MGVPARVAPAARGPFGFGETVGRLPFMQTEMNRDGVLTLVGLDPLARLLGATDPAIAGGSLALLLQDDLFEDDLLPQAAKRKAKEDDDEAEEEEEDDAVAGDDEAEEEEEDEAD